MTRKRALFFDSGVGGLSVLDAVVQAGLAIDVDYAADNAWLPYGEKDEAALRARTPALIRALAAELSPDAVVLACNTASTLALAETRAAVAVPVIGVVPPIKPAAALSQTGVIGVLATPATIRRPYLDELIAQFAADKIVIRCGSSALVAAAEARLAGQTVDADAVREAIACLFGGAHGARLDVVALSCTHFPLVEDLLAAAAPRRISWLNSGEAIARRVRAVLNAGDGEVRARRACFTAPHHAERLFDAFAARGFSAFGAIGPAPGFAVAPQHAAFG